MLPWTFELPKDYRPLDRANRFRRRCRDTPKSQLHVCKILRAQLVLLDAVIRLQIKGNTQLLDASLEDGTELQELDREKDFNRSLIVEAPAIVAAIMHSHCVGGIQLSGEPVYHPWDLYGSLCKHCTFLR